MTPVRTCVGCGRRADKRELLRFVARAGALVHDPSSRAEGRGAYLCPSAPCFERALSLRAFSRALRGAVQAPPELLRLFQEG